MAQANLDREYMITKLLTNTGWREDTVRSWTNEQLTQIYRREVAKIAAEIEARYTGQSAQASASSRVG